MTDKFFAEQAEQSQVKTAIVTKYFWAWAQVMLATMQRQNKTGRIAYIDLFAGPGRYEDGSKSTPLLILEQAIADPKKAASLVTIFNDKEPENTSTLKAALEALPGYSTLKHAPQIVTNEVGEIIVKKFEETRLIPTLFFVDPWGYKGLSLRLINSVLKDWGCECLFFFNYNRINMGLGNDAVKQHMEALFGSERAAELSARLEAMSPDDRELVIVEEICEALVAMGGKYVLPFTFRNGKGTRTSHHLIFVSKHPLGYDIMKQVMARESSNHEQGVPTFEYNRATKNLRLLFELARPLDDLEEMLLTTFAGRSLRMIDVFNEHNYGRRYVSKNYKDVLLRMEKAGTITTDKPYAGRRKLKGEYTFADDVIVTFPQ